MSRGSRITWEFEKNWRDFSTLQMDVATQMFFFSTRAILHGLHHFVQSIILWPTEPSHIGPCFSWSQELSNG